MSPIPPVPACIKEWCLTKGRNGLTNTWVCARFDHHEMSIKQHRTTVANELAPPVDAQATSLILRRLAPPHANLSPSSQCCGIISRFKTLWKVRWHGFCAWYGVIRWGGVGCNGEGEVGRNPHQCYVRQPSASITSVFTAVAHRVRLLPDGIVRQDVPPFAANACCACQRLGRQVGEDGPQALFV